MTNAVTDMYEHTFGGRRNLSLTERAASVAFGLAMAAGGLNRKGGLGLLMGVAGGALALRGLNGHCPVKAALEHRNGGATRQLTYDH
jgi:uncharacterized membrane protein